MATKPTFFLNTSTSAPEEAKAFYLAMGFTSCDWCEDSLTKAFSLPAPNQNICIMLHGPERFKDFVRPGTAIADANKTTETLFTLAVNSREEVDAVLAKAVAAGGKGDPYKMKDFGAECDMYCRSFADLDGHIWEAFFIYGNNCMQQA
ncbi:hypothetical protein ACHAQA_003807 [Verticillium albo-atrum]